MHLDDKISELLYHYDCVIIPEFGGFITNYKPAHLDERLHLFHPPSKEISFNRNLKRNDGLLAHYLAEVDQCSFEEANEGIRKSVEDYFSRLNKGERVVFNKVGIIYRDSSRNLRFQPSHEVNFLKDAFGLEKIFAVPTELPASSVQTEQPVEKQVETRVAPVVPFESVNSESIEKGGEVVLSSPYKKWAWAAAFALPVLAYSSWLISSGNIDRPSNLTIADLNPFKGNHAALYAARQGFDSTALPEPERTDETANLLESDSDFVRISFTDPKGDGIWVKLKMDDIAPVAAVNTYTATAEVLAMRYHIIGGCFSELNNARKLVDELRSRGYNASIFDKHKGLYRVTFADFNSRKEALNTLRKIKREEMNAAWLLVH